jgi:hypothetical protein
MSHVQATSNVDDLQLARSLFARTAADLAMILDRELEIGSVRVERLAQRPVGEGCVHISFKLAIERDGQSSEGCVLVPLPDALALAGFLMTMPEEVVARERLRTELDGPFKEALLEVGKFLAGACDAVLRQAFSQGLAARSRGCQGVRAGVRPALVYREGDPLTVARARARVHAFEPFELILVLPSLGTLAAREVLSA